MSEFVLRFVQEYAVGDREALMDLEPIAADEEHEALFRQQAPLITGARTEIYEVLEL
jgi:hypothetical protein